MSSNTNPSDPKEQRDSEESAANSQNKLNNALPPSKGKGKEPIKEPKMEEEEEEEGEEGEEEEEEMGSEEEASDDEAEEDFEAIDPGAIISRRTRGVKVNYTSEEALKRAGLDRDGLDGDDGSDVEMD